MEYYGLRKSGNDVDLVVCHEDIKALIKQHPDAVKNLGEDLGVVVAEFEIWKTINYFGYAELVKDAVEEENYFVISLDALLKEKAIAALDKEKYQQDLMLIAEKLRERQNERYETVKRENGEILD